MSRPIRAELVIARVRRLRLPFAPRRFSTAADKLSRDKSFWLIPRDGAQ